MTSAERAIALPDQARQLRAQVAQLGFERADPIEERQRDREASRVELEVVAQTAGRPCKDEVVRAERLRRRLRIDRRDGTGVHQLVQLRFRQPGKLGELGKRGLPTPRGGEGDLFAIVQIAVPTVISEAERALYKQLAEHSTFNPRAHFAQEMSHANRTQ